MSGALALGALSPGLLRFGLILTRVTGVLVALPLVSGEIVPVRLRAALAAAFAFALGLAAPHGRLPDGAGAIVAALAGELIVGAALGLLVRLSIAATEALGSFVGMQMGLGFGGIVDPLTQTEGAVASLLTTFAWLIFLAADGHHEVLRGLADSLRALPAGEAASALGAPLYERMAGAGGGLFAAALRIAAPITAVLLATNVAVALIARVAPKVNLLMLGFLITVAAGLVLLALTAPHVGRAILGLVTGGLAEMRALARGL